VLDHLARVPNKWKVSSNRAGVDTACAGREATCLRGALPWLDKLPLADYRRATHAKSTDSGWLE
jgi:hypothetical protein